MSSYSTSRGRPSAIGVTPTADGYHVTFSPAAPCLLIDQTDLASGYVTYYPTGDQASAGSIGYGQGYTMKPDGTWDPFSYDVPKFAAGTTLEVWTFCVTMNENESFVFSPVTISYPAA